jgi:hypothetical protein
VTSPVVVCWTCVLRLPVSSRVHDVQIGCRAADAGRRELGRAVAGGGGPGFGQPLQIVLPEALGVRRGAGGRVGDLGDVADRVLRVDAVGDPVVRRRRSLGLDGGEPVGAVLVGVGDRDLGRSTVRARNRLNVLLMLWGALSVHCPPIIMWPRWSPGWSSGGWRSR